MSFTLHSQLAKDCLIAGDLPLSQVLLMNNRSFPWLILVPRRANMRELFDLSPADYQTAIEETRQVAEKFARHTGAHKMNVAALGNMVAQLHIHIIARFESDAAWPAPVWNSGADAQPYSESEQREILPKIQQMLGLS